jgi:uncharacterized protein YxeA
MKKLIISAVMVLALAGGSVFAAQNSNKGGAKPAATMKKHTKKKHRKAHKKAAAKAKTNKNM